jgi:DNA-binding NarL/FixJ family response regulator
LRILVVTAQPLFGAALEWAVQRIRPEGEILQVGGVSEALEALRGARISLVLIDGNPVDCDALDALQALKAVSATPVAIISSSSSSSAARQAIDRGACGYIAESSPLEHMASMLCHLGASAAPRRPAQSTAAHGSRLECQSPLTAAQGKVLSLIGEGQLNKQIAFELGIAESTVKAHVSAIFRKLKVQNRVQATLVANRQARRSGFYEAEMVA